MKYSSIVSSNTLLMYAKITRSRRIIILNEEANQYAIEYTQLLLTEYPRYGLTDGISLPFNRNRNTLSGLDGRLLTVVKPNDLIIFIGSPDEFYKLSKIGKFDRDSTNPFPTNVRFLCTDTCESLENKFSPTLDVCVCIPYSSDYTQTTRNLYRRLFQIEPNEMNFYSYVAPFSYDCGYRIGTLSKVDNNGNSDRMIFIALNQEIPAALSTTGLNPKTGRPDFGNYVFCYTKGPIQDLPKFRKELEGAIQTLPNSADIPFRMGKYSWTGITEYAILVNYWEIYSMGIEKMSVQSKEITEKTKFGYNEFVYSIVLMDNKILIPRDIPIHLKSLQLNYV